MNGIGCVGCLRIVQMVFWRGFKVHVHHVYRVLERLRVPAGVAAGCWVLRVRAGTDQRVSERLGCVLIYFETHFKVVGACSSNLQLNLIWELFGSAGSSMLQAASLQFI